MSDEERYRLKTLAEGWRGQTCHSSLQVMKVCGHLDCLALRDAADQLLVAIDGPLVMLEPRRHAGNKLRVVDR